MVSLIQEGARLSNTTREALLLIIELCTNWVIAGMGATLKTIMLLLLHGCAMDVTC
jgi:hypothetical protein